MDFKIDEGTEEIDENGEEVFTPSKKTSNLPLIIVIVVSIIIGLLVFFVSNAMFGKKETKPTQPTSQKLDLSESNVVILYDYVKYGTRNTRGEKFIKEKNVTLQSFTNEEKFYYALQFADAGDFSPTGKINENKQKEYLISNSKIKQYMQRFFGPTVTYTTDDEIKYPFVFKTSTTNEEVIYIATMKYSEIDDGFITTFELEKEEKKDTTNEEIVKPYYASLVSATKEVDGSYTLEEKIVYTKTEKNEDNTYNVSIYKDYDKTSLIETKNNQTTEMLKASPITIDKYKSTASTITYKFKLSSNTLYFYSSEIK